MADSKITALTALTAADPANDMMPIVDVSDTSMAASGTTKRISINNILACSPSATLASATITGDLTVATDRLKVVTGSTAIQTGSTTQLQVGTTAWPSGYIGKSGSRSLFGNTGEVIVWNESAAAIGNYSSFYLSAKTGAGATTLGGSMLRGGIENASDYSGFISLWTQTSAGTMTKRYEIDSSGNSVWSVGGSTAMTLNSTGLGVGVTPKSWLSSYKAIQIGYSTSLSSTTGTDFAGLSSNAYVDSVDSRWERIVNGYATQYYQNAGDGQHIWRIAGTAAADTAITWTNAMTLDASGRLFVGATSITAGYTGNNYFVVGGVTSPTIKLQSTTGPAAWDIYSAGGLDLFLGYNAVDKGQFSRTTGAYTALSDANKKKDFEPSNIGLAEVLKLKPTLFRMIGAADDSSKELGFVAQDVQSVIPQAYVEAESQGGKFIGLQDRPIIAALTRAIQELAAEVNALKNA